jgi:hypothetical protein
MNTNNSWKSNISILENIINESIDDEKLHDYRYEITENMNNLFQYYTTKRLDYNSYDEINKEILENITNLIVNLKEEKKRKKEDNSINKLHKNILVNNNTFNQPKNIDLNPIKYKKDDLLEERINEFNNKLQYIRNDFINHNQIKAPEVIDFSDKETLINKNIDALMEEEMKKRQYDTQQTSNINESERKKAEEWFSNPTLKLNINNGEKEKIKILDDEIITNNNNKINKDVLKKAFKKVSFEVSEPQIKNNNTNIDNLLNKLKEDREKDTIYPEQEIKEKSQHNPLLHQNNTFVESKNERNEKNNISQENIVNYLIINKNILIEKTLPFIEKRIFISLETYKIILLKIYENDKLVHETEMLESCKEELKDFVYYKLLIPFNKENKKYNYKFYDTENNELFISLNNRIKIDKIFDKIKTLTINNEKVDRLNNDKIMLITLTDNLEMENNIINKICINDEEVGDFLLVRINKINNEETILDINIENNYNKTKSNCLLIDKKYNEKLIVNNKIILQRKLYIELL